MMFTDCYSFTASPLIHWNRPNRAFLSRRSVGQLYLRTTAPSRGCICSSSANGGAMMIDGNSMGRGIFFETATQVSRMKKSIGVVPQLAVVRVGNKDKTNPSAYGLPCRIAGIDSSVVRLPETCSEEEVLECVSRLNHDPCVHGILVQLPLPSHVDEDNILSAVSLEKDVQGVHPLTTGRLAMMHGGEPLFLPPGPKGCIELLHHHHFEIKGKRAAIIGRNNNNFGIPLALLLQREDATVTLIHSKTNNPEEITRQADIVISAVGKQNMVRGSWVKPGAVVINVGRSIEWPLEEFPFVGDICYEEVCKVASAIIPASSYRVYRISLIMLMSNILTSAKRFHNFI